MGIKKTIKKGKKVAGKAGKAVDHAVDDAAEWAGKQLAKGYNATTGAIEGSLDDVLDYAEDQCKAGVKYAEKTYNQGVDWLEDLAQDAIEAAYQAAYDSVVGDYIELAAELLDVETQLFTKPSNVLTSIRDGLFAGKFSKAAAEVQEFIALDSMKKAVEIGHELHGTSFILAADLSFGASYGVGTAGATGSIGITQMLDHFEQYEHSTCVFAAAGASAGFGTKSAELTPGAEFGIIIGFLSKDPTNIGGWFVDLSGGGGFDHGAYGLGLSWSPPGKSPPYVKPKPVAGTARIAVTTSASPSASITLGGSYSWLLQKVKNELYRG